LTGGPRDHDSLIEAAGGARFVLLGEASHGTHELPDQFDAVLHFDQTRAVEPLEVNSEWSREDVPETYPSAL
jgi:erythromycin esterase-like protein